MTNLIIELLLLSSFFCYSLFAIYLSKKDKLMPQGRPVIAEIINIKSVRSDGEENTTFTYILDVERHLLKGAGKIEIFYAPQFKKGK